MGFRGSSAPSERHVELYHFAILFPNKKELAKTIKRLIEHKYPLSGFADHVVSEAIYLKDPDGNGVELYADKPKKDWPKAKNSNLLMHTRNLDIKSLLAELE